MQIDDNDEAVRARTAIIDHVAVCVDHPTEENHSQRLDLSRDVLIKKYRVGTFWLLQRVYRHFLHNRVDRNVRPVPEPSRESLSLDCAGKEAEWWPGFLSHLEPAAAKDATTAGEVDLLLKPYDIELKGAKLFLQAKGFTRVRSKRNLVNCWLDKYRFADKEGVKGEASFVRARVN